MQNDFQCDPLISQDEKYVIRLAWDSIMLQRAHLQTIIAIIDHALGISDMIDEPLIAAELSNVLQTAQKRLKALNSRVE